MSGVATYSTVGLSLRMNLTLLCTLSVYLPKSWTQVAGQLDAVVNMDESSLLRLALCCHQREKGVGVLYR